MHLAQKILRAGSPRSGPYQLVLGVTLLPLLICLLVTLCFGSPQNILRSGVSLGIYMIFLCNIEIGRLAVAIYIKPTPLGFKDLLPCALMPLSLIAIYSLCYTSTGLTGIDLSKYPLNHAAYYSIEIWTTLGLGDILPTSHTSKILTGLEAFNGTFINGFLIAVGIRLGRDLSQKYDFGPIYSKTERHRIGMPLKKDDQKE